MQWKDVVAMAADVARNGFNVTHDLGESFHVVQVLVWKHQCHRQRFLSNLSFALSLFSAEALAKMKDQNTSASFRDLFLPNGRPPLPGLFAKRLDLAAILDAVAVKGISEFYSGNLTQEMAAAVRWCPVCVDCFTKTFFFCVISVFYLIFLSLIGESSQWRPHRGGLWKLQHSLATTSWDQLSRCFKNRPCYSTAVKHSFNLMHSLIFIFYFAAVLGCICRSPCDDDPSPACGTGGGHRSQHPWRLQHNRPDAQEQHFSQDCRGCTETASLPRFQSLTFVCFF